MVLSDIKVVVSIVFLIIGNKFKKLLDVLNQHKGIHFSIELLGGQFATNAIYSDEELLEEQSATREMVIPISKIAPEDISKIAIDGRGYFCHSRRGNCCNNQSI